MNWDKFKAALLKALIGGSGFAALLYSEYVLDIHSKMNDAAINAMVLGSSAGTENVDIIDSFVCAAKIFFGGAC